MNHSATTPKGPGNYLFDDTFIDGFNAPKTTLSNDDDIRRNAHVANGGEQQFRCPSCNGTGRFRTYSGRDGGPCFKCKGKGNISRGQNAAIKGKATKAANQAQWQADNADAITYVRKRADKGSTFYQSFLEKMAEYGTLTENQMAIVYKDMAKDAEFYAAKKAERIANAPEIDNISAVQALFDKATENDVKRPIFRTVDITISKAPMSGKNPGALYVKTTDDGTYCGKIVAGKFHAGYGAPNVLEALKAVAIDPGAEAIKYASKFSRCGICGTATIDPVSVRSAVGPICARKWGLEYVRDAARESLKAEKEAEEGQS
jgi:hypothetical protein